MIVFDLACPQGHRFEGWFPSGDDYDRQRERGLVRCPVCDDAGVAKLPSARVSVRREAAPPAPPAPPAPAAPRPDAVAGLPAELVAKLREVVRATENVGARFPEEARRIHYNEAPARSIRGKASAEEAEALREEGIDFAPVPPFLTPDAN